MTGMKEGAGEDPFAEDDDSVMTGGSSETETDESAEQPGSSRDTAESQTVSRDTQSPQPSQTGFRIPYKFRRDGVQDGRDRVPLFLHSETKTAERDAQHDLEDRFDDDVSLTDLREALVMVGLDHLDEVEQQLEEWGYGMTFD
jgi:hypothetical protein